MWVFGKVVCDVSRTCNGFIFILKQSMGNSLARQIADVPHYMSYSPMNNIRLRDSCAVCRMLCVVSVTPTENLTLGEA
jgi:hypothetical protein